MGARVLPGGKELLNHFLPGSAVLSFWHGGCNLACKVSPELEYPRSSARSTTSASRATPDDIARTADEFRRLGRSAAFT